MSSLIFLVPLALLLGGAALAAFFWSLKSGQYDDLQGASERIFVDQDGDRVGARHSQPPMAKDAGRAPKVGECSLSETEEQHI
nr:cbb3-type cytochrome oxidase assembly protein CcoS [Govania unica]